MTLVASLAVLSACGGGGGSSGPNPVPSPVPVPTPTPTPSPNSVTGRITFVRIPFGTSAAAGLDYSNPQNRPSRGITVRALAAGTTTELARAVTDEDGDYAMNVTSGTNVTIEVIAEMVRAAPTALPHWNFSVRDLPPPPDPTDPNPPPFPNPLPPTYTFTDGVQFTAGGAAHDILIPSGLGNTGTATGTRASAPFAILDTFYQAVELVRSAKSDVDFPQLVADWGINNVPEDGTFFTSADVQHMVLTADLTADTDEFDQHVIAHEFGHYIEYNFSRADNIGGSHGLGDKLDARVAFGEGFGYAFGAIVLNDPVTRDSFVDNGFGCPNDQCSSTFNVQSNPPQSGGVNGNFGCWCSESSVWSILWDVFDNDGEAGDTVTLGFMPIWNVLVGPQRTTPAFTTIFSFITALKDLNPGSAAAINTLVAAQNINGAAIDAFGSTEANVPTPFTNPDVLPIYAQATIGGPQVTLRSVDTGGPTTVDTSGNKLSNHRYIRFLGNGNTVTVTATSTSPLATRDVDFLVYRTTSTGTPTFTLVDAATDPPAANQTSTFGTANGAQYLLDVYDCANGCDPVEGTPGDYDLTVTIN